MLLLTIMSTLLIHHSLHPWLYKYGNHLTPGLAEVRVYAPGLTSFPAEGFRLPVYRWIPALKAS